MRNRIVYVVVVCLLCMGMSPADTIDRLSSWDTVSGVEQLGEVWGGAWVCQNFGQTFTVTSSNARLDSISMGLWDYNGLYAAEPCRFNVTIMAWDGSRPTGPVLYQSAPVSSPIAQTWQTVTVPLGGTFVQANQQYVAILEAALYMNDIQSYTQVSFNPGYSDGEMVYNLSLSPGDQLSQSWSTIPEYDLAFKLDYTVIPEPATLVLLGLGCLTLLRKRNKIIFS